MTREEIIEANDRLRTQFKGGNVFYTPYVRDRVDPQIRGRALQRLALFDAFADDSLHDFGVFVFAGFSFVWEIKVVNGERTLTLSLQEDWLVENP